MRSGIVTWVGIILTLDDAVPSAADRFRRIGRIAGITAITASVAAAGVTAWAVRECHQFQLRRLELPLLPPGTLRGKREFRLLHISDLHMVPGQRAKQEWVAGLDQLQPDLVVNTGDNLSDLKAVPATLRALGPLMRRPGLFVFGSNDYYAPTVVNPLSYVVGKKRKASRVELPWLGMRAAFIEHGWQDATHRRLEFKVGSVRIAATGVDDPHHDLDDYGQVSGAPNAEADLRLALVHSPEPRVLAQFAADGYQLALCGHTHGGQICLPGGKTLVTNCGIDRVRAWGLHEFDGMMLHVSNGLGTSKFAPVRLFCRPSATLISLVEKPDLARE